MSNSAWDELLGEDGDEDFGSIPTVKFAASQALMDNLRGAAGLSNTRKSSSLSTASNDVAGAGGAESLTTTHSNASTIKFSKVTASRQASAGNNIGAGASSVAKTVAITEDDDDDFATDFDSPSGNKKKTQQYKKSCGNDSYQSNNDDDDDDMAEMMDMANQAETSRKPLKLKGLSEDELSSGSSTSMAGSIPVKVKKVLSVKQLADLSDFLNDDDDDQSRRSKVKQTVFGSIAPTAAEKRVAAPPKVKLLQNQSEVDTSYGQVPVDRLSECINLNCKTMTKLCLASNGLTALPNGITSLLSLQWLDVRFNKLVAIQDLKCLKLLQVLNLQGNQIEQMDGLPQQLSMLNLSNNKLQKLKGSIVDCKNMESLDISSNLFVTLPGEVLKLKVLKHLDASGCKMTKTDGWLSSCAHLVHLNMSRNQLTAIPAGLDSLSTLEFLDMSSNCITMLPQQMFKNMFQLKSCRIAKNQIQVVPDSIQACQQLIEVDFRWNPITSLPQSMVKLSTLTAIMVDCGHQSLIKQPPLDVCRQGANAILDYMSKQLV